MLEQEKKTSTLICACNRRRRPGHVNIPLMIVWEMTGQWGECQDTNTRHSDTHVSVVTWARLIVGSDNSLDLHAINIPMHHKNTSA